MLGTRVIYCIAPPPPLGSTAPSSRSFVRRVRAADDELMVPTWPGPKCTCCRLLASYQLSATSWKPTSLHFNCPMSTVESLKK